MTFSAPCCCQPPHNTGKENGSQMTCFRFNCKAVSCLHEQKVWDNSSQGLSTKREHATCGRTMTMSSFFFETKGKRLLDVVKSWCTQRREPPSGGTGASADIESHREALSRRVTCADGFRRNWRRLNAPWAEACNRPIPTSTSLRSLQDLHITEITAETLLHPTWRWSRPASRRRRRNGCRSRARPPSLSCSLTASENRAERTGVNVAKRLASGASWHLGQTRKGGRHLRTWWVVGTCEGFDPVFFPDTGWRYRQHRASPRETQERFEVPGMQHLSCSQAVQNLEQNVMCSSAMLQGRHREFPCPEKTAQHGIQLTPDRRTLAFSARKTPHSISPHLFLTKKQTTTEHADGAVTLAASIRIADRTNSRNLDNYPGDEDVVESPFGLDSQISMTLTTGIMLRPSKFHSHTLMKRQNFLLVSHSSRKQCTPAGNDANRETQKRHAMSLKQADRVAKQTLMAQSEISHAFAEPADEEQGAMHRREFRWGHPRKVKLALLQEHSKGVFSAGSVVRLISGTSLRMLKSQCDGSGKSRRVSVRLSFRVKWPVYICICYFELRRLKMHGKSKRIKHRHSRVRSQFCASQGQTACLPSDHASGPVVEAVATKEIARLRFPPGKFLVNSLSNHLCPWFPTPDQTMAVWPCSLWSPVQRSRHKEETELRDQTGNLRWR